MLLVASLLKCHCKGFTERLDTRFALPIESPFILIARKSKNTCRLNVNHNSAQSGRRVRSRRSLAAIAPVPPLPILPILPIRCAPNLPMLPLQARRRTSPHSHYVNKLNVTWIKLVYINPSVNMNSACLTSDGFSLVMGMKWTTSMFPRYCSSIKLCPLVIVLIEKPLNIWLLSFKLLI